jgi:hypothetical protein
VGCRGRDPLDPPMLILLISLMLVWLVVAAVIVALCRMAARSDAVLDQSPRRPSTCGTVRSRILTSHQSDQLATYR